MVQSQDKSVFRIAQVEFAGIDGMPIGAEPDPGRIGAGGTPVGDWGRAGGVARRDQALSLVEAAMSARQARRDATANTA